MTDQEAEQLKGQMYGLSKFMGDFITTMMIALRGGREKAVAMCDELVERLPDGFLPEGSTEIFEKGVKEAYRVMSDAISSGRGFDS